MWVCAAPATPNAGRCEYVPRLQHVSDSPGITGEIIACMAFECARYQVDAIAGDGNKACYLATPKSGGVPTCECSLLQYWINKMMNVATQSRRKHFGDYPPVRVKHFISEILIFLQHIWMVLQQLHTPQNSQRRQKIVVIVVCYRLLSGDMHDWSMRKISVNLMINITWIYSWVYLQGQWNLLNQWSQHLHGCTYRQRCAQPHSCSLASFRYDMEGKACLCSLWDETEKKGKEKGYAKVQQEKGSWRWSFSGRVWKQLVWYWLWWFLSFILVRSSWTWRPKNRWVYTSIDEDNTAWFAQYSFSVSSFLFHKKRYTLSIARDNTTTKYPFLHKMAYTPFS